MSGRIMSFNEIASKALQQTQTCIDTLAQLDEEVQSNDAFSSLPGKLDLVIQKIAPYEMSTLHHLPSSADKKLLQERIAECWTAIQRIRTKLYGKQTREASDLQKQVQAFVTNISTLTPDKIQKDFETFEKRSAELQKGGHNRTLEHTRKYIEQNKERIIASGTRSVAETASTSSSSSSISSSSTRVSVPNPRDKILYSPSHSSSSCGSSSIGGLVSEFAKSKVVASFATQNNTNKEATLFLCQHFIVNAIVNPLLAPKYLDEIIDKGRDSLSNMDCLPEELVTHKIKDLYEYSVFDFTGDALNWSTIALSSLEQERTNANYNSIGAVFNRDSEYTGVVLSQSNETYSVLVFNPNGNPKTLKGVENAFCLSFNSLAQAAQFLAQLYQDKNQCNMHMFASKRIAEHRALRTNAHRSSSSSSTSSSSSSQASDQAEPVVQPSFRDMANAITQLRVNLIHEGYADAVKRLIDFKGEIPVDFGAQQEMMPIGALAFYHLTMIHYENSPSNPQLHEKDYGMKAFLDTKGYTATYVDRMRALLRTETDILLQCYASAVWDNNQENIDKYGEEIRNLSTHLDRYKDSIPELKNFYYSGIKFSHLNYVHTIRAKLKAQWKLV